MASAFLAPIDRVGHRVVGEIQFVRRILILLYLTIRQFFYTLWDQFSHRQKGIRAITRVVVMQIYFTGVQAMPLISLLALIIGSAVVLQSVTQLSKFGGINQLGDLIVLTIIRDVGPLLTMLIVIARSGTAVAVEIATMRVNREIDALESMGISLLDYIVIPRVIGGIISIVGIGIWFSTVGVIGGYILAAFIMKLHWGFYINKILLALSASDLILFLFKSVIGGGAIFLIACLQGFSAGIASYEVPIVTIGCVVKSLTFCLVFHALVTSMFYVVSHYYYLSNVLGLF